MHVSQNGTRYWKYGNYLRVGSPESGQRAFQTLTKMVDSEVPTTEEFHYQLDTAGRLSHAAFMQTPQATPGDYSVPAA